MWKIIDRLLENGQRERALRRNLNELGDMLEAAETARRESERRQKELEQRTFLIKQKRNLRLGYIKNRKGDARFPQPCETVVHFPKA